MNTAYRRGPSVMRNSPDWTQGSTSPAPRCTLTQSTGPCRRWPESRSEKDGFMNRLLAEASPMRSCATPSLASTASSARCRHGCS